MPKLKVKTIDIQAKEWFDRVNGNSYFAGLITINFGLKTQKEFNMPFQYGYGDHYRDMALKELQKNGFCTEIGQIWELRDKGIILRATKQENCKKRELKEFC